MLPMFMRLFERKPPPKGWEIYERNDGKFYVMKGEKYLRYYNSYGCESSMLVYDFLFDEKESLFNSYNAAYKAIVFHKKKTKAEKQKERTLKNKTDIKIIHRTAEDEWQSQANEKDQSRQSNGGSI